MISDTTSPVKLVGKIRGSKPRIAPAGLGARLAIHVVPYVKAGGSHRSSLFQLSGGSIWFLCLLPGRTKKLQKLSLTSQ